MTGARRKRARSIAIVLGFIVVVGGMYVLRREAKPDEGAAAGGAASGSSSDVPTGPLDLRGEILRRKLLPKVPASTSDAPRCVLFDWGMDVGAATLVAFDDGTTSLYTEGGGGYIGMGAHATVRQASEAFREEAARSRRRFKPTTDLDLPGPDAMAFFLVTDGDTLGTGPIPVKELQSGRHPLSRLGELGNEVITQMRLVSTEQDAGK